ncbi:helix-turn-helix domain-containing protein [Methylobacterium litchii]|uniref:helix-turn-helix domain-containing protein n=1 Tax=Methylobacterium litchii TaxID=3138810 RepID=UPI00399D344F
MFVEEIRRQAEAAPRAALPAIASAMWKAFGEGHLSETEAEALSALIEARRLSRAAHSGGQSPNPTGTPAACVTDAPLDRQNRPRTGTGSRPRTDASLERRRRWAASGRLPPALAARFTVAEQAVLSLVAAETAREGDCRLSVPHLAAVTGVAERTVQNTIREARKLGLLTVEERRVTGYRNDTNVLRIVSPEWTAWLRLARKGVPKIGKAHGNRRGGCKSLHRTPTQILEQGKTGTRQVPKRGAAIPISPSRAGARNAGA